MSDIPGLPVPGPRLPPWNELTNDQREAIMSHAVFWGCEECWPAARDAVHGLFNDIRDVMNGVFTRGAP